MLLKYNLLIFKTFAHHDRVFQKGQNVKHEFVNPTYAPVDIKEFNM